MKKIFLGYDVGHFTGSERARVLELIVTIKQALNVHYDIADSPKEADYMIALFAPLSETLPVHIKRSLEEEHPVLLLAQDNADVDSFIEDICDPTDPDTQLHFIRYETMEVILPIIFGFLDSMEHLVEA